MVEDAVKETIGIGKEQREEDRRHLISITHKTWKILMMEKIDGDLEDFDTIIDSAIQGRKRTKESFNTIIETAL